MKKISIDVEITSENKCSFCKGSYCCTYITQQIDTPRSMEDFDTLLWQVSHQDTEAYKDDDGWFLLLPTRCMHLEADGRCAIYEERPQVCREHTNDDCEFDGLAGADDFDLYFKDYKALNTYCKKRYKRWDNRFKKWAKEND